MPLNSSQKLLEARRREAVARLRLRGLSQRQIADALAVEPPAGPGIVNPKTGKPFALGTINADLQALEAQWRAAALGDTGQLKAEVWAELREARRAAWSQADLDVVLRALRQEADLCGLNAPAKQEVSGPGGGPIPVSRIEVVRPAEPAAESPP